MELVISIVAKIAEYTVAPVGQWLCYSCHYNSNMENLRNQEKNLRDFKKRVLDSIDAATRKGEEIEDDVKTWLTKVDGILHQLATEILGGGEAEAGTRSSNAACPNLKHRHQLSREAKKIVENIAELLKNVDLSKVGFRPTAQEMVNPITRDYMSLDSRISIMEGIMEALGDANINRIGVWGLAGVGKTTLMEEIFQKAKEESLFHEVALANVTDTPDVIRIQGEIAEMLGLELDPDKIVTVRAGRLRARLEKDNEKKILVMLDDVWKQLDLEEIGITPSERCKVLLTSRDWQVLANEMGTEENCFKLDILGEEEAWKLFEKMAGDSIKDDHDLQNEAIKVAKSCEGLPIALVTVSRALKNKNLSTWKDALVQLTRPTPEHDTKIWSRVYSCIELSYKHLDGREVKSLFLLCARQGYYISYRDLLRYGFGLRLFYGIDTLEEARNRLETLVNNLRDSCLLLQSPHSSEEFYMHDVVRRVATIIASNDHNMFVMRGDGGQKAWPDVDALKICEALSIHGGDHIHKYPNKIECPNLRYFHVQCKNRYLATPSSTSFQGMDKLEDIFFQGMDKLEVLSLTNIQLSSLLSLRNLQTLCLDECNLGDIHGIGELKNLVILSLARSDISNLPTEIGLLTRLRLLDLSSCYNLKVIPPNVLSSLVNLEELYMRKITVRWEVEGPSNEGKNASLAELKKLSHLITLEIDIPDANNLPIDLFTEKLKRYKICIGGTWYPIFKEELAFSRMLKLKLNMSFQLDSGIKMLLKRTEYLHLDESNITESVLYQLDREDFQQLKHLCIKNNGNIKHIPELRTSVVAFPILETFVLENMISLVEICQGNLPLESFKNLKVLKVGNCEKLRFIFSSSIARGLSLLEVLMISRCNNLGAIFVKEEEDGIEDQGDMMLFGRLQTLVLRDLPKLVGFLSTKDSFMPDCRETNSEDNHDLQLPLLRHDQVSFPSLQKLCMEGLPKIKYVWSCGQEPKTVIRCLEQLQVLEIEDCGVEEIVAVEGGGEAVAIRTLVFPRVSFPSLQTLRMKGLPKIKYVWSCGQEPTTVFRCLEQLQVLEIIDCGVEEIVAVEGGGAVGIRTLVFPQVTKLYFRKLRRLKGFCQGVYVTQWPMLKEMTIQGCHNVEIFASEVVSFEKVVEDQRQSKMSNIKQPLFSVDELSFPSLEILQISNMDSLEIIFGKLEGQNGKEPQDLISPASGTEESGATTHFVSTLSFPSLKKLDISGMDKLEIVWQDQVAATSFPNIPNANNLPANFFSEKLERYRICIGVHSYYENFMREVAFSRVLKLKLNLSFQLDVGIKMLMKRTEYLYLDEANSSKSVLYEVDGEDFQQLKHLHIQNNDNIKHILESGTSVVAFPILETFVLKNMISLVEICQGNLPLESFKNLKVLKVGNCEKLIFIFSSSIARGLSLLEELNITGCNNMVAIFVKEEEDGIEDQGDMMLFGRLKTLVLEDLPKLVGFLSSKDSFMADCRETNSEGSHDLQLPLLHHDQVSFPSLQKLRMKGLRKIKYVWSCGQEPKTVNSCLEQLQVLEIVDCGVEEIVAVERGGEAGAIRTMVFPQVTKLKFRNLPRLKWFYKGVHVSKWPMLKEMEIERCEKVEIFASEVVSFEKAVKDQRQFEMSIKQALFSVNEHSIPSLEILFISNMDSVEIIFGKLEGQNGKESQVLISPASGTEESGATTHFVSTGKLPLIYFKNLKVLEVENYQKLRFLFSSSIARGLSLLEKLKIKGCNNMGAIVVTEEKDGIEDGDVILFHQLQTLVLEDLPELVSFLSTKSSFMTDCGQIIAEGNHDLHMPLLHHQVSFPSLQTLRMKNLPKIKHVWSYDQEPQTMFRFQALQDIYVGKCKSLTSLFPAWVLRCLEQLQVLEIEDCGVEEIVAIERGGEAVAIRTLVVPQVTQLKFRNLPRLKWFYKGVHVSKWPMLKEMKIERCEKVEIFASEVVSFEKAVKDQRQFEMSIKQALFSVNEHSIPSLEILFISNMDSVEIIFGKLEGQNGKESQVLISPASGTEESGATTHFVSTGKLPLIYFKNLKVLEVENYQKLRFLFSSSIARGLSLLEKLKIKGCNNMGAIVVTEEKDGIEDGDVILFHQLQTLVLEDLPELVSFLSTKSSFMTDCGQIIAEGNHNLHMPLLHHQVSFPSLQTLRMKNLPKIKHVWSYDQEPQTMFRFQALQDIYVGKCESLTSLFPAWVLRCLEQLQVLEIEDCGVEEIVAIERGGEAVAIRTLVFPQVTQLKFRNLPRLKWFYKGVHVSKWPMLKEMKIERCEKVEIFASEVVSFEKAVKDQRQFEMSIKQALFSVNELSFPSLKELDISGMDKLEIVWQDQVANNLPANLFSKKLERYKICIGVQSYYPCFMRELDFSRVLKLKLNFSFQLDVGIKMLMKRTEYLYLDEENSSKSVLYEVDREDFQQLKHLHIQNNGNMKHILESGTSVVAFPILETFVLENMFSLEEICQDKLPLSSFKNLKVLKVENCEKLKFIFSSSIARGLSLLEELNITRCDNLGAIFVKEEEDGIEDQGDMMLFGRLQTLVLKDLPKLVGFLSTKDSFMADCRETNSEGNHVLQLPLLHHDQVSFPSLQTLRMKGLPKIKYVWSCGQEPKTVIRCLEQLQVLEIEDCGVEEIVAVERGGGEAVAIRTLVFPRVSTLELRNLKRLKWFCKGVHVSKWPMLKKLKIEGCEEVEILASGVVSFEGTIKERQSEMSIKQPLFLVDELSFPSLKTLHIEKMDKLEIIWQDQVTASSFPNIQELRISDCDKLLHVFQSNLHTRRTLIQSLTSLHIKDCDSLETIFRNMEGQNDKESQVLIAPSFGLEESIAREEETTRHIEFPTLTEMSLVGLPKLKWILEGVHTNLECPSLKQLELGGFGRVINMIWASKFSRSSSSQENQLQTCVQQPIFEFDEATFPNLEILSLRFSRTICPSRFSDFPAGPSFPIIRLPTLLELEVRSSRWEEIFSHELVDREIRLRGLSLNHLPMLIHLWKEDGTQPCPLSHNLQFLSLSGCGKLKNLVPSSVSLHNLTYLLISSCHGLINLLTSSTAKTLVQLRRMAVTDCKRITEIVAMEDGEANVEITFKKLAYLELDGLPNLTHFCSRPYSFGFPSSTEVIVRCCPEMKTFCHRVLSTPELTAVYDDNSWDDDGWDDDGWDDDDWDDDGWDDRWNSKWKDDLNTTTRCLWKESNQYDTQCLFRERVENSEEDEDHP